MPSHSRDIAEIVASPQAASLVRLLLASRVAALTQVQKQWIGVGDDLPPRAKQTLVKSELKKLIKLNCIRSYVLPILWPPILGVKPYFTFSRGDSKPDFHQLSLRLERLLHIRALIRPIKVYTCGEKIDALAHHCNVKNPFDPPELLRMPGEDSSIWGQFKSTVELCEQERDENQALLNESGTHCEDIAVFLKRSYLTRLLNLSELYLRAQEQPGDATANWYVDAPPFGASLRQLTQPRAVFETKDSTPATFLYSKPTPDGPVPDCVVGDPGFLRALPKLPASRVALLGRGLDEADLEALHASVMDATTYVAGGVAFRFMYDCYEIW